MTSSEARLLIQVAVVFTGLVVVILIVARFLIVGWFQSPGVTSKTVAIMNKLSDRVAKLERDRERDHETIMQLRVLVEEWMAYARMLAALLRRLDQDVPPAPATQAMQVDDRTVVQEIVRLFSETEIDDLVFQLKIKDGEIGGSTKGAKARNLVSYARRHGMTEELIALAQRERPEGKFT